MIFTIIIIIIIIYFLDGTAMAEPHKTLVQQTIEIEKNNLTHIRHSRPGFKTL